MYSIANTISNYYHQNDEYRKQILKYLAKEDGKYGTRQKSPIWKMLRDLQHDEKEFMSFLDDSMKNMTQKSEDKELENAVNEYAAFCEAKAQWQKENGECLPNFFRFIGALLIQLFVGIFVLIKNLINTFRNSNGGEINNEERSKENSRF